MIDYIKDNYMQGTGNGDTWHVRIDPPKGPVLSYYEEAKKTAEYVWANKTGHLYLLYSGGMDSEYVFSLFLELGFNFTPVVIKLGNYNEHDLKYAFDFCSSKGVDPKIIEVDFDHFVKSGKIVDIATSIKCSGHQIPATMHIAEQLDGFVVLGNDPPYMKLDTRENVWKLEELELIHSILTFFKTRRLEGCPFFLSYTPEMMLSFLLDPTMVDLANHRIPGKLGTNTTKVHVYNNGSNYHLVNRPKYTGYEIIEKNDIFQHENLKIFEDFSKMWGGAYYEPYHQLVERLSCTQ